MLAWGERAPPLAQVFSAMTPPLSPRRMHALYMRCEYEHHTDHACITRFQGGERADPKQPKRHSIARGRTQGKIQYFGSSLEGVPCSRICTSYDRSPLTRGRSAAQHPLLHGPPRRRGFCVPHAPRYAKRLTRRCNPYWAHTPLPQLVPAYLSCPAQASTQSTHLCMKHKQSNRKQRKMSMSNGTIEGIPR